MELCLGSGPLAVFTRVLTQALIDNNFMASIRSLFASPIPKALGGAGHVRSRSGVRGNGIASWQRQIVRDCLCAGRRGYNCTNSFSTLGLRFTSEANLGMHFAVNPRDRAITLPKST